MDDGTLSLWPEPHLAVLDQVDVDGSIIVGDVLCVVDMTIKIIVLCKYKIQLHCKQP